jgi:hypothetical protein
VSVRFVDAVGRRHAGLISDAVQAALDVLGVELDVAVDVVGRDPEAPITTAWASPRGVFLRSDLLDGHEDFLRMTVTEEVGRLWTFKARPALADSVFHRELFASWLVRLVCDRTWLPDRFEADATPYVLGKVTGSALAGSANNRRLLEEARLRDLVELVDRLDSDKLTPEGLADALEVDLAASC